MISEEPKGCRYINGGDDRAKWSWCDANRRAGSAYCDHHHAVCYVMPGSRNELLKISDIEALAEMMGGRISRRRGGFVDQAKLSRKKFAIFTQILRQKGLKHIESSSGQIVMMDGTKIDIPR